MKSEQLCLMQKKREMALDVKILVTSILANLVAYWFYEISKLSPIFFTNKIWEIIGLYDFYLARVEDISVRST